MTHYIAYILLFVSVLTSGMLFFLFRKTNEKYLKLSLAFSGAYLFAITVTHLVPDVYTSGDKYIGIYVLCGFLFQIVLEFFSEGIEHGHIHLHKKEKNSSFPLSVITGLCVHSFLEGVPLIEKGNNAVNMPLYTGIILHHIPIAFALVSMLMQAGLNKKQSVLFLVFFAVMAPFGAAAGSMLGSDETSVVVNLSSYFDKMLAVVIGIFLHISTTILFEYGNDHRFNLYKMLTILLGALIGIITL